MEGFQNHNIHLLPNLSTHDPDIQHLPFFAISPVFLSSRYSSHHKHIMSCDALSRIMLPLQHKPYFVIMSLARFNPYVQSYGFLLMRSRRVFRNLREFLLLVPVRTNALAE